MRNLKKPEEFPATLVPFDAVDRLGAGEDAAQQDLASLQSVLGHHQPGDLHWSVVLADGGAQGESEQSQGEHDVRREEGGERTELYLSTAGPADSEVRHVLPGPVIITAPPVQFVSLYQDRTAEAGPAFRNEDQITWIIQSYLCRYSALSSTLPPF